ncbi:MAG TPA: LysM domain-containing protein [Geobacteraceae bacterium]|nr:LysM domain-containing protein [Geobacteraceae bacterium]
MSNQRYVVKNGDTLWNLADKFLGAPTEWPRLYAFNNEPEVVRITGRRIEDPDLIFAGQTLLLPILPGLSRPKPAPSSGLRSLKQPAKLKDKVQTTLVPFMVKYNLDDLLPIVYEGPAFKATIRLSGDLVVSLANKVPLFYVTNKCLEWSYKAQTDELVSQLISEPDLSWDRKTNKISYGCNFVTKSTTPNAPHSSIGIVVASDKPVPVLKAEICYPTLKGMINGSSYLAMNSKAVIEIEPRVKTDLQKPVPDPIPLSVPLTSKVGTWSIVGGTMYLVGCSIAIFFSRGSAGPVMASEMPIALKMMGFSVKHEIPGQKSINIFTMAPNDI